MCVSSKKLSVTIKTFSKIAKMNFRLKKGDSRSLSIKSDQSRENPLLFTGEQ